ncbi:MAG: hypothetical protein Dbin4_02892 [Alphaproteobacteria bacterium]|nr:hypothetical protein [Alphaproteobacteria bacterium]
MTIQNQANVDIAYKAETSFGVAAGATGAQSLRRVSSSLALNKDSFSSAEIAEHGQIADLRHGVRRVAGDISGELSAATYKDWFQALLRGTLTTGVSFSASVGTELTTTTSTIVRAGAGSFITDGFKVGDVIRLANLADAANNGKNLRITALTALEITVAETLVLNATADSTASVTVVGKKVLAPSTRAARVNRSFTIEQNHADIDLTELFLGCRVIDCNINVSPGGIATVSFSVMGQDGQILTAGNAPYFTSPTAVTATTLMAGPNGFLRLAGVDQVVITAFDLSLSLGGSSEGVVGKNIVPDVFTANLTATGNISFFLENETLLNNFINEDSLAVQLLLTEAEAEPKGFLSFHLPKIKFTGSSKTIGASGGVIVQQPFQALINTGNASNTDLSTIIMQDSEA